MNAATRPLPGRASWRARRRLLDAAAIGPLRVSAGRSLLAAFAIALGVALGFSVYLINRVAADEVQNASRSLFGMADLSVQAAGAGFDEQIFPRVAELPGVAAASPAVEVQARLPGRAETLKLVGIDPFRASKMQPALAQEAARSQGESGMLAENSVWLSASAAHMLGLSVGDELDVQVALQRVRLEVAGLLPSGAYTQPLGMLDIGAAQWRLQRLGKLDRIDVRLVPGADVEQVRARIAALLPSGVTVTTPGEAGDEAVRLTRAYRSNLTALALVALFTGAFLVYATQSLAVARRRREIALLHAMGMTVREQLSSSLLSGAIVGAVGSALGVVIGIIVARAGLATFGADLGAGYFSGLAPQLDLRTGECLVFFALGVTAAIAATLGPAREAAAVPAAAALKAGDEAPIAARRHELVALVLAIAAVAALALPSMDGIALPGYAAIASLLLAAVFITPSLATVVLGRLPERGPAWRQVAVAQLRGTARRSTVSIAAVLVSFSLMVAMAIMVFSFRMSLEDWTQRILPADLYVRAGLPGQTAYLDRADQQRLASLPGVVRTDFMRRQEVAMPGGRGTVLILARDVTEDSIGEALPLLRTASDATPAEAVPVWVSEAIPDVYGFDASSEFDLALGGRTVRVSVRGVWRDYERPGGVIVMPRSTWVEYTGDDGATSVALWLADGVDAEQTIPRVRAALGQAGDYDVAAPQEIRRHTLGIFDRTFAVTYLLEAVAVLIGLFGISASMSSQVLARRGEFGMLRHLGITRREVGRMLAFEGAALGSLGVAAGLVVGAMVSLILIYVVNRQSFHWTMDVHVPWVGLGVLSLVLIVAAAVTAAVSGRQAMTGDVVRAVKEDW